MSTDAYYPTLCATLGLTTGDLAELAGYSRRSAQDAIYGRFDFHKDVREALDLLKDDVNVMVDSMVADVEAGCSAIFVYRTNEDLRAHFREWPARGKAAGGFVGPHRVAAMAARDMLDEDGIEVDLLFGPE